MLNAATIIIRVSIINITFLSTFKALKNDLFVSDQVETKMLGLKFSISFYIFLLKGSFKKLLDQLFPHLN